MSQSESQRAWISHYALLRTLHRLCSSLHPPVPTEPTPVVSSHVCLRPWGCAHRYSLCSPFFTVFLKHIHKPACWNHRNLFLFILSWWARSLCGGDYLPSQVRNRVWVSLFQSWHCSSTYSCNPYFVLFWRWCVCVCWLVGLRAALSSKLIWWMQINGLPSAHQQSTPSPAQVSGSTHFFKGFISQKSVLTI